MRLSCVVERVSDGDTRYILSHTISMDQLMQHHRTSSLDIRGHLILNSFARYLVQKLSSPQIWACNDSLFPVISWIRPTTVWHCAVGKLPGEHSGDSILQYSDEPYLSRPQLRVQE
jgi:hypothetical protein